MATIHHNDADEGLAVHKQSGVGLEVLADKTNIQEYGL
tara:strand:- start:464 stop:577 length:114 start_codon:yes stop_codon:yes gene_type:complete